MKKSLKYRKGRFILFNSSGLVRILVKYINNLSCDINKDKVTGLPILASVFSRLELLVLQGPLSLLYIDIVDFRSIKAHYGEEICNKILCSTVSVLKLMDIDFFGIRNKLEVVSLGEDDILIFIDTPRQIENYEENYNRLKTQLEEAINDSTKILNLNKNLSIHLGYSDIKPIPGYCMESLVYKAIKEASFAAKNYLDVQEHANWYLLKNVLHNKKIKILYQSIVSLKSGDILGFEALSRGPAGSSMESPLNLFKAAEYYDCLLELENLCHETAVSTATSSFNEYYLFLNISPSVINKANNHRLFLLNLLKTHNLKSANIVLELTERNAIDNYPEFREILYEYRNQGFLIAIDDAGAGYSSLQAIAELKPEFVKIDMSLVHNIDKNPTKKALLETLVDFSYKIGAKIICEGIETVEELITLAGMGCDYGQGFFIGKPGPLNTGISSDIRQNIKNNTCKYKLNKDISTNIGDLVKFQNTIDSDIEVSEVIKLFNENKVANGFAVCKDNVPVGLIMRDRLFSMLGTRYGYDLFAKRPVSLIMDKHPLTLSWFTPLEDAACQVAERLDRGITDYVIVTKDQYYFGIVSVAKMLDTLAKIQISQAKDANPLTGLPGNRCIASRIINSIGTKQEFTVLYFDLDEFKAFNDYYGFEHGDRALNLLANIIVEKVSLYGNPNDLAGHLGGDDFVVITSIDKAEKIANEIIKTFDQSIINLYDKHSQEQGYILSTDRQGLLTRYPIMSLSIAGVTNTRQNQFENHLHLSEVAAEIKKLAKSKPGSCYLHDRRHSSIGTR